MRQIIDLSYLNPIAACHTNANSKKKTGMIGKTSIIGLKITYASGRRDNIKISMVDNRFLKVNNVEFNTVNFTIKLGKFLIYVNI